MKLLFPLTLLICAHFCFAQVSKDDEKAIRAIFADCERGYNERNAELVLKHYSKDLIVSYPGEEDMDYAGFEKAYENMMKSDAKFKTTAQIDEIAVSGDMAMVRMFWNTVIPTANGDMLRQAKDLQIFRRENGAWKFYRGMWYHLKAVPVK